MAVFPDKNQCRVLHKFPNEFLRFGFKLCYRFQKEITEFPSLSVNLHLEATLSYCHYRPEVISCVGDLPRAQAPAASTCVPHCCSERPPVAKSSKGTLTEKKLLWAGRRFQSVLRRRDE